MQASPPTQFYSWQNYQCAYTLHQPDNYQPEGTPLLLIHPIGVGLSGKFWQRFINESFHQGYSNLIYNPDLLGCGGGDKPHVAYTPKDWAEQLQYFLRNIIQKPVIVIVQGALLAVALELVQLESNLIAGLIFTSPPTWTVITNQSSAWRQKFFWNLFDSPLGNAFYRYARTPKFLQSFSTQRLFAVADAVDGEWLNTLTADAANMATRYAVFSFLAGFWKQDYGSLIAAIQKPTLVVLGESASSMSQEGKGETPDVTIANYLAFLQQGTGVKIPGRNVLPYESTTEFVRAIAPFIGVPVKM
ncbi:alpha/beta fold hydrolase [Nostoc sp. CMAA1605]|uniref:alpha/beta fold hydrolase n=1 Tax=Nostoc sp. CMAA1605 TaxID=2055159 RepID=UPI001F34D6F1|nr:alpha/beta hydrolase [Nostoc sp. CMAA1605]MCF4970403.1 alpha/beta hydrolase [Nostoc sp. CMAA1605]